jgi:catechol 2,3-dioxygenase-like lactoylglutathione lyase family enzyme
MAATLEKASGYQDDHMNLPVPDLDAALPFYENVFGFRVVSRSDTPQRSAILERDSVRIGLAENGKDPTQDGVAFHVKGLEAFMEELNANGLAKKPSEIGIEEHGGATWNVFYAIAPDGLCFWFGERRGT